MGLVNKLSRSKEERAVEAIARNLEAVFNTKKGYGASLDVYGLGAYDAQSGFKPLIAALCQEMEEVIRAFEPRLIEPAVRVTGRDERLWVHLSISGTVDGRPRAFRVLFHSVFRNVRVFALR